MEENTRVCDICGCELAEGEGTWVGDQLLCEDLLVMGYAQGCICFFVITAE